MNLLVCGSTEGSRDKPRHASPLIVRAWGAAVIILCVLAAILTWEVRRQGSRVHDLERTLFAVRDSLKTYGKKLLDSIARDSPIAEIQLLDSRYDPRYVEQQRHLHQTVKAGLRTRPDLIPFKAVLGGRMDFRDIVVLDNRWAYAHCDDGHVEGRVLLEWERTGGSTLKWKVVASHPNLP